MMRASWVDDIDELRYRSFQVEAALPEWKLEDDFVSDQAELLQQFNDHRRKLRAHVPRVWFRFQQCCATLNVDEHAMQLAEACFDLRLVWQVLAGAGWVDCDPATQDALSTAQNEGRDIHVQTVHGCDIEFHLRDMLLCNVTAGTCRDLRQCSPWREARSLPRWEYKTQFGWRDCDLGMQKVLLDALREAEENETAIVQRTVRDVQYEFDFAEPSITPPPSTPFTTPSAQLRYGVPDIESYIY